ncbi:BZ3500_MvSof-1268-A1-R1_Chr7-3g09584 [Microbotryum saponariae]|uniref:BZ3500_MvSof-1268-A1-R1_Chr7-3g09584 protein n=1 Tax=Microbotryum saponariae TaxID=289078 RepID=A0A2X0LSL1_9BASI|nr:BZ3501_MvSof-1269-A2-R1_Chr7-2g09307 [Microbotryum saponariae]SDA02243.1 BZ3500_MvSof-1268-A1-R1_Chr7-3g09584 [Microbotryum saponariae]
MRILIFLAFVAAVSEGVLGFQYLHGEGQLAPSNAYLFRVRNNTSFNHSLTIFDACQRLYQACDKYVKPIQVRKADSLMYYAHHVLDCRPDLSKLPVFYAACGYRISPTPGEPTTYNSQDIPIDVTWEALNGLKYYQIFPRGDEMLRGTKLGQAANSAGRHSDHSHQLRAESQPHHRSRIHHHRSLKAQD